MNEVPVSIYSIASSYHKSQKWVKTFIDAGKVRAFNVGGGSLPRLRVYPSEFKAVVDAETIYKPPGTEDESTLPKKPRVAVSSKLHPAAVAM